MAMIMPQGMTTYEAAGFDRLLGEWLGWYTTRMDAVEDWNREGLTIAQRAWKLVLNDPYATALMATVVSNVIGTGMRGVSQYQADDQPQVSPAELNARRMITAALRRHSRRWRLDPGCQLSRVQIETQLLVSGFVAGDGFAVRCWNENRPGCAGYGTCWRVLDASRVQNPDGKPNEAGRFVDGIELRAGIPTRLHWVDMRTRQYDSTDWWAADGSRNVIHYSPDRMRAGGVRGFSKFAPLLKLATYLMRTAQAHVSGKRIQASHPMSIESADPVKAAEAHRKMAAQGSNSVLSEATIIYTQTGNKVTFPTFSYQGSDFDSFAKSQLMSFCAAWGYPWQFVLHQLTDANLASAQAALDQADKTTNQYQDTFISDVEEPMDDSILREADARGTIVTLSTDWDRISACSYDRPRRADANRLRTRQAGQAARELGVSPSTVHAEMGYSYEDEIRRTAQDMAFAAAHGVDLGGVAAAGAAAEVEPDPADPAEDTETDDADAEDGPVTDDAPADDTPISKPDEAA